jgi:hypothetical protein
MSLRVAVAEFETEKRFFERQLDDLKQDKKHNQ